MKLSFRRHGLTRAQKRRIILLIPIFFVSLIGFIMIFNVQQDPFVGKEMEAVSLPTISVDSQGEVYGEFFGYKNEIDIGRIRNGLIPLDSDREITYHINQHGNDIDKISYAISSGDGERRIASGEVSEFEKTEEILTAKLSLSNLIDEGREYVMAINLSARDTNLNYYMRIKYVEDGRERECLDFAKYFMNTALSDNYRELATYMEPKNLPKYNGLSTVTINSSLNDVGWKGFEIQSYTEPSVKFAEIDSNYTALELSYVVIGAPVSNPGTFLVNEYYRMRKGEERIFLLDFERNITQVFTTDTPKLEDNKLILGQNGENVEFVSNRTGTNVAFVWGGGLYEYNSAENVMTRVFYFGAQDINDERTIHREYNIDIINIDENGNLYYAVYGYMNAGDHEGNCGVGLYHYDPVEGSSTEQAFIITNHSYASLKAGFDGDIFLSSTGKLYVCIENELMCSDISTGNTTTMISGKDNIGYALSMDRRYLAYSGSSGKEITIVDLFTDEKYEMYAPEGKVMRVVAFMGEDLVYGIIPESEYNSENISNNIYPMENIIIADVVTGNGETIKNYSKEGYYVTSVEKESDYNILIKLSRKVGNVFIEDEKDSIQNISGLNASAANLSRVQNEERVNIAVEFTSSAKMASNSSVIIKSFDNPNIAYFGANREIMINASDDLTVFYAYRGLKVKGSSFNSTKMVNLAYANTGYMVDNDGNYIWQYGRGNSRKNIDLNEYSKADKQKYNLIGCEIEEILSYIYRGIPVYVNESEDNECVIIGFDSQNINIYNSSTREIDNLSIENASLLFKQRGKKYTVYINISPYSF